jgi:hypothetical protein
VSRSDDLTKGPNPDVILKNKLRICQIELSNATLRLMRMIHPMTKIVRTQRKTDRKENSGVTLADQA